MKLRSLFHFSLITLASGITADLTAAAVTVQPNAQSSSAFAQAEAKEARAEQNTQSSAPSAQAETKEDYPPEQIVLAPEVQRLLTLTFPKFGHSWTFNKKENFCLIAHLFNTNVQTLPRIVAQAEQDIYDAIKIVRITELERPENVKKSILQQKLSLEAAMAWYTAYMQVQSDNDASLELPSKHGAIEACREKIIDKFSRSQDRVSTDKKTLIKNCQVIDMDEIVRFLLKNNKQLSDIRGFAEDTDAAQYLYMNIYLHLQAQKKQAGERLYLTFGKLANAYTYCSSFRLLSQEFTEAVKTIKSYQKSLKPKPATE